MKVLCIHGCTKNNHPEARRPIIGESYNVTDSEFAYGELYYKLSELGDVYYYIAYAFIPISDIDETEFVRNYKTETV